MMLGEKLSIHKQLKQGIFISNPIIRTAVTSKIKSNYPDKD